MSRVIVHNLKRIARRLVSPNFRRESFRILPRNLKIQRNLSITKKTSWECYPRKLVILLNQSRRMRRNINNSRISKDMRVTNSAKVDQIANRLHRT
jgi:hypothetical protein